MSQIQNILVVVQKNETAKTLLSKASDIACGTSDQPARIHAVRIVYEGLADITSKEIDKSAELKDFILRAEEEELRQVIADASDPKIGIEPAVLWHRRLWEGVIQAAEAVNADLIMKASEENGRGFIRTPDDWNILRESKRSVFLARPNIWRRSPIILVAIDALDNAHEQLSERILAQASELSQQLSGDIHICTFYPLFEPWSAKIGLLQSYKELRKEIERDIAVAVNKLIRTIGAPDYKLHVLEASPEIGIDQVADSIGADIVVIGNRAREGLEAVLIGNTAEKILHQTQKDILTVV